MPTASIDLVKRSNAKLLNRSGAAVVSRSSSLTQEMLNSFLKKAFLRLQK
jgi:UDP-N-acetylglucosamine:LPS N-acetylglucosamine transferase